MNKKIVALALSVMMVLGVPGTAFASEKQNTTVPMNVISDTNKNNIDLLNRQITKAIIEQGVKSEQSQQNVELLLITNEIDITNSVANIHGKTTKISDSLYIINIPANRAAEIAKIDGVKAVGRDRILSLPKPIDLKQVYINGGVADPNLEYSHERTGMAKFWRTGFDGRGTKVAIIDTGVEPANEMLTLTTDGKLKIIDQQDFMKYTGDPSESDVKLLEVSIQAEGTKKYVDYENSKIYVPSNLSGKLLVGQYLESKLLIEGGTNKHDVNNNGRKDDKIAVIVTNYDNQSKLDDAIYVDTNYNNDLNDEKQMGIYKEVARGLKDSEIFQMNAGKPVLVNNQVQVKDSYKSEYSKLVNHFYNFQLGTRLSSTQFNFVISRVEQMYGSWYVNLCYDGNSHGTHVAGDAAGNGYKMLPFVDKTLKDDGGNVISPDGTLQGAAPGAQILACRVFESNGGTPESAYMKAMEYACKEGADVINMSLGSLPEINDGTDISSVWVNILSKKYGTVFCISAGNDGPSTNALGTPGASEWAVTVGAYNPGWINYGNKSIEDGLWYFSSRGPTEDGRLKPTIMAPGSMISSTPMWNATDVRVKEAGGGTYVGYALEQGTSMSSPYTAGVIATIKQAMKQLDLPYHPLVVKEAIFETGTKANLDSQKYLPTEIGGGMINPVAALEYLKQLKAKGLTQEGLIDSKEGYIDRNKMVVKTEFDYTEKLNYKPEGLYIRSGDIPNTVNVTIKNTTDNDLNLNLTKDSYGYSNEWLTLPVEKLQLNKGEEKVLSLTIDKSKLNQGINAVLIKTDDSNTVLNEGYIPLTIINYMDLSATNGVIAQNESGNYPPGASDKHFIRIPYGTLKAEIVIHMTDSADTSNLLPFVTAPSGIQVGDVPGSDWLYQTMNTRTLILNNPEPGTWELDLFSGLIAGEEVASATGKHSVTAKLKGIAFGPSEIKYSGRSGEYKEQEIALNLLNATTNENQPILIRKTNLAGADTNKVTRRMEVNNKEFNIVKFTVPANDPNIFVNAKISNTESASDDLDLELHRLSYDARGNEVLGATIAMSANAFSDEKISLEALEAGEYAFLIDAYATLPVTHYDFIYQVANSSDGENDLMLKTTAATLTRDLKEIKLGVRVPSKVGKYSGMVYATDLEGNILGKAKVTATSEGTDNNLSLKHDSVVRINKNFDLTLDGEINESNNMNNIYGVQFSLNFDPSKLSAIEVLSGEIFKNANVKEIAKQVSEGRVTYAVGFLNTDNNANAMGAIKGNIAMIKLNAKAIGNVSISFDKLLIVNHRGDEIALNTIFDNTVNIVNPNIAGNDNGINILDICKLASKVGKSSADTGYDSSMDFNKDGAIDFKDFDFIIKCFNEDN